MAQTANINGRMAAMARRRAMAQDGKTATKLSPEALLARESSANTTVAEPTPVVSSTTDSESTSTSTKSTRSPRMALRLQQSVARLASRQRRQAMSSTGKAAIKRSAGNVESSTSVSGLPLRGTAARKAAANRRNNRQTSQTAEVVDTTGVASETRKCHCGCKGDKSKPTSNSPTSQTATTERSSCRSVAMRDNAKIRAIAKTTANQSVARVASLARRKSMSIRGKAGMGSQGLTPAQTARAANPQLSGRQLAQSLREQRSRRGKAGQRTTGASRGARRRRTRDTGAAEDAPWKVGASETTHGQTVTGTMVGRSQKVSGDEQSTCRPITGTEYMGADIFREFCQTEPEPANLRGSVSETHRGQTITGNKVGRSQKVTGDEQGSCKNVTGDEYISAEQMQEFCGTSPEAKKPMRMSYTETLKGKLVTGNHVGRSEKVTGDEVGSGRQLTGSQYMETVSHANDEKVPPKVGSSETLRGSLVTGNRVGRSQRVTGDEQGSCRNITGDDYVGKEQYQQFCEQAPQPQDQKVGQSGTLRGESVTGTMTGRSVKVTGDESGTCKAVTGTPYAGLEQYQAFCGTEQQGQIFARTRPVSHAVASVMTGLQPSIGGKMTGDEKGQCEPLTGTPYVGHDQFVEICASANSSDFPQPIDGSSWGEFSINAPLHASKAEVNDSGVTGTGYENGHITGPFGKATGRVTGTEEFRFGSKQARVATEAVEVTPHADEANTNTVPRITGEGMEVGSKITGDDWGRNDRVTGTEGSSATRRNPTRRGGVMASMAFQQAFKNREEVEVPVSVVTGSSGNTANGALVTYSGGARG